jgi:transposase
VVTEWATRRRNAEKAGTLTRTPSARTFPRFVTGLRKDLTAVRAALAGPWSNGQTEGRINTLKVIRRQMYGRGKLDLLEARLIGAS